MLDNRATGCGIHGIDFNRHDKSHLIRAAQEGIVFSFKYGIDIMEEMGIPVKKIHAGHANMFLSSVFLETLAGTTEPLSNSMTQTVPLVQPKEQEWERAYIKTMKKHSPLSIS